MKQLITLVVGALLFSAMSITSLSAADMKCGAGKCGASMKAAPDMKKPACCQEKAEGKACVCPADVKCSCKDKNNCTCDAGKKAPASAMKCGKGKCG